MQLQFLWEDREESESRGSHCPVWCCGETVIARVRSNEMCVR